MRASYFDMYIILYYIILYAMVTNMTSMTTTRVGCLCASDSFCMSPNVDEMDSIHLLSHSFILILSLSYFLSFFLNIPFKKRLRKPKACIQNQ